MGYKEITHTADLAIKVWGDDLESLFSESARGMYSLMGIEANETVRKITSLSFQENDYETMLVSFLSDLLFNIEHNHVYFKTINPVVDENLLLVELEGFGIKSFKKVIKAVTFHNLEIIYSDGLFQTEIVFDV